MAITSNLEKIYFNWILLNPDYFKKVHGYFFENDNINFIYDAVKTEFLSYEGDVVPTKKEIFNIVKINDTNDTIDGNFIKALLKYNEKDYTENFVKPKFEAWVKSNYLINGLLSSYEEMTEIDKTNLEQVDEAINKIKLNIDEATGVKLDKVDIGLDFDDPESHDQDLERNKITSGFETFDNITDGGWDRKTLNFFMGSPGVGKSLTLQNVAVNGANAGYNVAYITLELSATKTMKRIGSMRLEIPIDEYTEKVKDKEFLKERIKNINNKESGGMFATKPGKLFIKEYPSGTATISDIEAYIKQVKDEAKIDIDLLVIDYIQIMGTEKGIDRNMLYLKGEHLAVGLRAIAQRHDLAAVTATQISKDKYGANNIELNDMPESKAMADTADSVWAIIQNPLMKAEGKYHWKHVKLRDCATEFERIGFEYDKRYLKLHSDWPILSTL